MSTDFLQIRNATPNLHDRKGLLIQPMIALLKIADFSNATFSHCCVIPLLCMARHSPMDFSYRQNTRVNLALA